MPIKFKHIFGLFLLFGTLSAETVSYDWGAVRQADGHENIVALFRMENWSVQVDGEQQSNVALPFVTTEINTFTCSNNFELTDSTFNEASWFFSGFGFKGKVGVFINNNLIYSQYGSNTPFSVRIPAPFLRLGKNEIELRFENDPQNPADNFPRFVHMLSEPDYCGPARPFFLEKRPNAFIEQWQYNTIIDENRPRLQYNFALNEKALQNLSSRENLSVEIRLTDANGNSWQTELTGVSPDRLSYSGSFGIAADRLWRPDNPQIHTAELRLRRFGQVVSAQSFPLALRALRVENNQLLLNGKKTKISGIVYHENLRIANTPDHYLEDLRNIRALGYNAVRTSGFVPDRRFFSIADTLGMLVFAELPPARYPSELYQRDDLLEISRTTIQHINRVLAGHPSFVALGLGRHINIHSSAAQKFYIILDEHLSEMPRVLSYITPVNVEGNLADVAVTDFMLWEDYNRPAQRRSLTGQFLGAANAGIAMVFDKDHAALSLLQKRIFIRDELAYLADSLNIHQGFFESYRDWRVDYTFAAGSLGAPVGDRRISSGHVDTLNNVKDWVREFPAGVWDSPQSPASGSTEGGRPSTVFSVVMFFGSLLFFIFYRQYPRFRENYRRAIRHPYGFFVDMRERRIIPVFNTFMVNMHNVLIMSVFVAAFIYSWHNSYLFREISGLLIGAAEPHAYVLWIANNPFALIGTLFVLFFFYPIVIGLVLKFIALFRRHRLRTRQAMAVGMWAAAPFIFMFPLSLAGYHLFVYGQFTDWLFYIFALFLIWAHYRLINGIRVLMLARFRTVFILLLLSYMVPVVIFLVFFNPQPLWFSYLELILKSRVLY